MKPAVILVSALKGAMLDLYVARARGKKYAHVRGDTCWASDHGGAGGWVLAKPYCPSRSYHHGGPILDEMRICFDNLPDGGRRVFMRIDGQVYHQVDSYSDSDLVLAMRCVVTQRYGPIVPYV